MNKLMIDYVAFEMFQHSSNRQSGENIPLRGLWDLLPENARNIWRDNAANALGAAERFKSLDKALSNEGGE